MDTVAVVTGTRAEYGLLRPVLQKLRQSSVLAPCLVVTGAHLSREYGGTVAEIEADGHPIDARLDFLALPAPTGRAGTAVRTAQALAMFVEWFSAHRPAAALVLGDRYEILAAAEAAALLDIPVAHISGGDVTAGADDDWYRHCITKMAKLHFPSCEEYRQRVIRMGEQPGRVFNVGGLGDENIRSMKLMDGQELARELGIDLSKPYCLVTFHPETATGASPRRQAEVLLAAIEETPDLFYLFTKANADAGGTELNEAFERYCAGHENAALFASLGTLRYLSAMKHAALVLGNSSSGLAETPSLGVPTVNIGQRQAGRVRSANVIDCPMEKDAVRAAIQKARSPGFAGVAANVQSPFNGGDTSGKIVSILEEFLPGGALQAPKIFYDGEAGECGF